MVGRGVDRRAAPQFRPPGQAIQPTAVRAAAQPALRGPGRRATAATKEFLALNEGTGIAINRARAQMRRFLGRPTLRGFFKLNRLSGEAGTKIGGLMRAFRGTPVGRILGGITKGVFGLVRGIGSLTAGFARLGIRIGASLFSAAKLLAALGAVAAITLTKLVLDMGLFAERSKLAFSFFEGGSIEKGAAAFERTRNLARNLGLDVKAVTEQMIALRKQQFSVGEAEEFVKLTSDMRVLGATTEQTDAALRAIVQIKAKKRLLAEELTRQLGNTGVSLDLVIKKVAELKGISEKAASAQVLGGKIGAELGLEAIKLSILAQLGLKKAGEASEKVLKTLPGLVGLIGPTFKQLFVVVAREAKPAIDSLRIPVMEFLRFLQDEVSVSGFSDFIGVMIKGLSRLLSLGLEFARGFGGEFGRLVKSLDVGPITKEAKESARDAGGALARFFIAIPKLINVALKAVQGLAKGLGFESIIGDANAGFDKIDFEKIAVEAESIGERIGRVIREAFTALTGPETGGIITQVGKRLGKAVIAGIGEAFSEFSIGDFISGQIKADIDEDIQGIKDIGSQAANVFKELLNPFAQSGRDVAGDTATDVRGGSGLLAGGQPQPTPRAITMRNRTQNSVSISVNATGDESSARNIANTIEERVRRALAEFADNELDEAVTS